MKNLAWLLVAGLLWGCGGSGGGGESSTIAPDPGTTFIAVDFNASTSSRVVYYTVSARKVGESDHSYIYLEDGGNIDNSLIANLMDAFDDNVYQKVVHHFGGEPDIDGDPKIYILLMDIRGEDSDALGVVTSYVAGYFDPLNENPDAASSNGKEIFFMDINPGNPADPAFYRTLAHEFQHMIHWQQKTNLLDLRDDTWLDEAMSEVAPFYAGYGPNWSRVYGFEQANNRSNSLTVWDDAIEDYYVAYMWGQYMADRFPDDVFRSILATRNTGIDSVEEYLRSQDPSIDFSSVFRDWSIALFFGDNTTVFTDNPTWTYETIDTWPGDPHARDGYPLPGMITANNRNTVFLPFLPPWSIDLRWYTSSSDNSSLTWEPGTIPSHAAFYDWNTGGALTLDMLPDTPYPYDNAAVLFLQNTSGNFTSASETANPALAGTPAAILSPAMKLMAVSRSASAKSLRATTGKAIPICMHEFLSLRAVEKRMPGGGNAN